jgi:amidase
MARTVRDAALLLEAMAGADPRDETTGRRPASFPTDLTATLDPNGLRGARIGVCRKLLGSNPRVHALFESAFKVMKEAGATVVDPADMPSTGKFGDAELTVLLYDFKADLNAYLAELGAGAPATSLADLIAFNTSNRDREMPFFDQELFEMAQAKGPLTDKAYRDALAKCRRLARAEGIDAAMTKNKLDALVCLPTGVPWLIDHANGDYDTGGSTSAAAIAGYPNVTVPLGYVFGLPIGISFFGRAWSEPTLLRLAYAFEQATKTRKPPRFMPTSEDGSRPE